MSLTIVIVNYRTADLVEQCLRSLRDEVAAIDSARVVVVDNDSGDNSVERLRRAVKAKLWEDWVHVVPLERNGGFAYGNNAGIKLALDGGRPSDFVFLLNPDTVVRAGAVDALLSFMRANPEVGIAGSLLEDAEGVPQCSARRRPSPLGEFEAGARLGVLSRRLSKYVVAMPVEKRPHRCDWVSGAALMVRREVVEQIGLMDEGYFLYYEEVDFCERARRAGWQLWFVPDSRIVHLEGSATGINATRRRRPGYWYDSRRRYFVKFYGVAGLIVSDMLWAVGRASLMLRRLLRLGGSTAGDPRLYFYDLVFGDLGALFKLNTWRTAWGRKHKHTA